MPRLARSAIDPIVAANIRAMLREAGRSAHEVSLALGRSPNWLSRIVSGDTTIPLARLRELADELGVSVTALVEIGDAELPARRAEATSAKATSAKATSDKATSDKLPPRHLVFAKRLAYARKQAGLSQVALGKILAERYATEIISGVEQGAPTPIADGLAYAAQALNVTTDWLLGLSDEPEPLGVAYVALRPEAVSAGTAIGNVKVPEGYGPFIFSRTRLAADSIDPENAAVFQVVGDSMVPVLSHGAALLVDKGRTTPQPDDIFIIQARDDDQRQTLFVKRYAQQASGSWQWVCNDPRYETIPTDRAEVLGRVCWSMERFGPRED